MGRPNVNLQLTSIISGKYIVSVGRNASQAVNSNRIVDFRPVESSAKVDVESFTKSRSSNHHIDDLLARFVPSNRTNSRIQENW
ncbi:hypothetical protein Y032_0011g1310 [Ancylostoma ceylanicum]|nr:hypothetical protein Y032_0011g1310 [Ancylostoma ceylanicum]